MIKALEEETDINLYNLAADFYNADESNFLGDISLYQDPFDKKKIFLFQATSPLVQIRHISGKILYKQGEFGSFQLPVHHEFEKLKKEEDALYRTIEDTTEIPNAETKTYRMISILWKSPDTILQIAVPRVHIEAVINEKNKILLIGIPIFLFVAAIGGVFLSGRALKPVQELISTAQSIDASELSQRVPLPVAQDDIRRLSETFNQMLDRIEKAFTSQERFIADASHQLLSPLTIIKGETEARLRSQDFSSKEKKVFQDQLEEIDYLIQIVQDMLLLARIDAGRGSLTLKPSYLDEVILESTERVEKIAKTKNIKIQFKIDGLEEYRKQITIDSDLIKHLVLNLLENSIKYSPENSFVFISLKCLKDKQILTIKDQGPGISKDQIETIFERFSRDPKLSQRVKGYGLGLTIAKKIADLHQANLSASNPIEGGALFTFEIQNG